YLSEAVPSKWGRLKRRARGRALFGELGLKRWGSQARCDAGGAFAARHALGLRALGHRGRCSAGAASGARGAATRAAGEAAGEAAAAAAATRCAAAAGPVEADTPHVLRGGNRLDPRHVELCGPAALTRGADRRAAGADGPAEAREPAVERAYAGDRDRSAHRQRVRPVPRRQVRDAAQAHPPALVDRQHPRAHALRSRHRESHTWHRIRVQDVRVARPISRRPSRQRFQAAQGSAKSLARPQASQRLASPRRGSARRGQGRPHRWALTNRTAVRCRQLRRLSKLLTRNTDTGQTHTFKHQKEHKYDTFLRPLMSSKPNSRRSQPSLHHRQRGNQCSHLQGKRVTTSTRV
ncbi:hypothetical protein T492DRAFT_282529, partial [Pavlovales sp. CCMP2436]